MFSVRPRICCLDLDTFFVSVERLLDPTLEARPVVVGGRRWGRGVVTAASYEARAFGLRSGMSLREASQLAPPETVFLPTRHGVYGDYAARVREILERFSPEVRAASIDEFYVDFTGCERLHRRPGDRDDDSTIERTVRGICHGIRKEVGLPASAGIGGSRIIAKVASGRAKPAGVLLVPQGSERGFLLPLPIRKFPGIGPKTEARMAEQGIVTLGDLVAVGDELRRRFSHSLARLEREIAGDGHAAMGRERPAFQEHDPEGLEVGSISNERTFFAGLANDRRVLEQLLALAERVCWRARKRHVAARTVTLKLRYVDFTTLTRAKSGPPTHDEADVYQRLLALLERAKTRPLAIRLLGVGLSKLVETSPQLSLPFGRRQRIGQAIDVVRHHYGYDAVRLGAASATPKA